MDNDHRLNKIVNGLVGATDPDEVKLAYKQWADTYDGDLKSFGYVAPQIGVKLLAQQLGDTNALIHDAGCGTGLVGSLLSQLGYHQLNGSDFSTSMLDKASESGHYIDLLTLDFSGPVEIESDIYDGVISIGVYSKRFDQHFIPEMVRILRPAGHFVFSCREMYIEEVMRSTSLLLRNKAIANVAVVHDEYMIGQGRIDVC